jgi:hypothetical protein
MHIACTLHVYFFLYIRVELVRQHKSATQNVHGHSYIQKSHTIGRRLAWCLHNDAVATIQSTAAQEAATKNSIRNVDRMSVSVSTKQRLASATKMLCLPLSRSVISMHALDTAVHPCR